MQLPVKAHYATLAMLAMAEHHDSLETLPARVIAKEQQIPSQFLGQILQQLRAAGLVTSTRGANGGFRLSDSPERISIASILEAVCSRTTYCTQYSGRSPLASVVTEVWSDLERQQHELLEQLSLSDLLGRLATASDSMFYI